MLLYHSVVYRMHAAAKSLQSCTTLCDPIDGSPPGSPIPGILQARTLEWVAISFCNAWKWKVKVKVLSCVRLFATPWTVAHQAPPSMGFPRQEYWSGLPFPSAMHESEKWKWSHSVVSDSLRPHGLQPTRFLRPWDFPGKSTGVGCHCLLHQYPYPGPILSPNTWLAWLLQDLCYVVLVQTQSQMRLQQSQRIWMCFCFCSQEYRWANQTQVCEPDFSKWPSAVLDSALRFHNSSWIHEAPGSFCEFMPSFLLLLLKKNLIQLLRWHHQI